MSVSEDPFGESFNCTKSTGKEASQDARSPLRHVSINHEYVLATDLSVFLLAHAQENSAMFLCILPGFLICIS